jgi:hypothetical protein
MTIRSQPMAANCERPAADSAAGSAKASHTALDFMLVLQTMIVEEGVFVGRELLDRAVTETHLLSEFLSKMAGSHSVRDLKTMWEECGQHQIDFICRDCERLLRHSEQMTHTTSKLFGCVPQT